MTFLSLSVLLAEINFTKTTDKDRIYSSNHIGMAVLASPVGNTGGYSYLYLVIEDVKHG